MRLSPVDIRQQQFTIKRFRGFDPQEVDTFLDDVAEDFEGLLRENAALREQLSSHEERSRGLGETEKTLMDTLVTTHRMADEMKENAKRDAQLLLREAALNGEKLIEESRAEEAKLRVEIQTLKRLRRQLIEELRATVERYDRTLAADLADAEPPAEVATLRVRVQPRASREAILGWREDVLRVAVTAPPVEGEANQAVRGLLARALGIAPSSVSVVRGERSRDKVVRIACVTDADLRARLAC